MVDLSQPGCGEIEESSADDDSSIALDRRVRILGGIAETLLTLVGSTASNADLVSKLSKKKPKKYEEYARG